MPSARTSAAARVLAGFLVATAIATIAGPSAFAAPSPSNGAPASRPPSSSTAQRATFGIGPATLSQNDPRGYFSYQMGAGGSYRDRAAVVNYGSTALDLGVYAADLGNASTGALVVGLPDKPSKDAGSWVHLPQHIVRAHVPAATAKGPGLKLVPFDIQVPSDAPPGDHGAAIVAVLSTLGKNPKGENIRLNQRVAARMYIRVNGELAPALSVQDLQATYAGTLNPLGLGTATVTYVVRNTGNIRLAAKQAVSVSGLFGTKTRTVSPADIDLLFPGGSQRETVVVHGVRPTIWQNAHVTLTPQLFQDEAPTPVVQVTASAGFYAIPWTLIGLVLLVILLIAGFFFWRRQRRRRPPRGGRHSTRPGRPDSPQPAENTPVATTQGASK